MAEDISARVAWALKKALTPKDAATPSGRGTATFVRRDESGVGWVRIPGNDFDTPVAGGIVAEAQPGDTVTYNIENNGVTITGNSTSPSVGGRFVGEALAPVRKAVSGLGGRVAASLNIAEAAQAVADAVNQHFWADTSGIHVTEATQEAWQAAQTGANVLINSIGQLFRDGTNNLLAILPSGIAIYDGNGNDEANVVASFTRTLIELGRNATSAVISLCGGRGVVRYSYESDFERYVFHIDSDGDFNVESRYESDDGTSTGVAGVKIGGTEQSQSLYSTEVALVATESDGAVDRNHTGRVTVGSGTSVDDPSDYGDASYVTVDGANVDIKANRVDFADPYNYDYANRGGPTLQLGDPTRYQNSGSYAITTAGIDTYTNGPRITIPAGSYMFVGAWTFNSASASGDRNMQVGFRSGASGTLWGERVRIRQSSGNFAVLNVSALRTFSSQTTVYLAGSASITSGAGDAWITAVRLN